MDDEVILVGESFATDAIGQRVATETRRKVFATVKSVSRAEWRAAVQNGLQPSIVFSMPTENYGVEKTVEWRGKRYTVYRSYDRGGETELSCEERSGS